MDKDFGAVIFDLDGTLLDSTPGIIRSWTAWAIDYGVTEEDLAACIGHSSRAITTRLLPVEIHGEALERIETLEVDEAHDTVAFDGAREALHLLHDHAAIATSGTRPVATARLAAAGIEAPTVFVTASDVEHAKPAPDLFLEAARRLGVDPSDCLVLEDSVAGVTAAKAAGCDVIAVRTTTPAERLATTSVGSVTDLAFTLDGGRIRVHAPETKLLAAGDVR